MRATVTVKVEDSKPSGYSRSLSVRIDMGSPSNAPLPMVGTVTAALDGARKFAVDAIRA